MKKEKEQIKGLIDGLFKGLKRDSDEKPDRVSEQQAKNQERIDQEFEDRKKGVWDNWPGIGYIPTEDTPL